jgi:hypothetical protein
MHILVNCYPEHPSDMGRSVLAEISARLSNGVDSEHAGISMLALVLCQLNLTGRLSDEVQSAVSVALEFRLGAEIDDPVTLSRRPAPRLKADFWESKGSPDHLWAGPAKAPSDLLIYFDYEEADIFQSLHLSPKKAKALISRVDNEAAVFNGNARRPLVTSSAMAVIRAYHLSLAGDSFGLPVSKWNWRDARDLVAGRIAWLLREEGLLEAAISHADEGVLRVTCSTSSWNLRFEQHVEAA